MKSRLQIIAVLLFIGIAGIIFVFSGKKDENQAELETVSSAMEISETPELSEASEIEEEPPQKIFVHVCGAVKKEGVYQVEADARVVDAIKAAGGLTKAAESAGINQAEPLRDGMQVYIPDRKEFIKKADNFSNLESLGNGLININIASKEELMKLKGVGEAKASLIISYREAHGGFKDIKDLMKIKGIKQKFFDKIKDSICI